jgi:hypothetical protein
VNGAPQLGVPRVARAPRAALVPPALFLAISATIHAASFFGLNAPVSLLLLLSVAILLTWLPALVVLVTSSRRGISGGALLGALPPVFVLAGVVLMAYVTVSFFLYLGASLGGPQAREVQIRFWTGYPLLFHYFALGVFLAQRRLVQPPHSQHRRPGFGPRNVYALAPRARRRTLATAIVPIVAGLALVAALPTLGSGVAVFGLVLAAALVSWLTKSAAVLRRVAWVEVTEIGIRTRDLLQRERLARWADVSDLREIAAADGRGSHAEVLLVSRDGRVLARLTSWLVGFEALTAEIQAHLSNAHN